MENENMLEKNLSVFAFYCGRKKKSIIIGSIDFVTVSVFRVSRHAALIAGAFEPAIFNSVFSNQSFITLVRLGLSLCGLLHLYH